jgi:rhodanese-related sulfurtransferase
MRLLQQISGITIIAIMAALLTWFIHGPPQRQIPCTPSLLKPGEICLDAIARDREVVWVDARSRKDWQNNGLPGSLLWNLDPTEDMQALEAEIAMKVVEHPYVIVYCGDENCGTSRQIADRIRGLGMNAQVFVLHGGWRTLKEAGLTKAPNQNP